MTPPLHGVRIVEIASIGPGPFAAMVLADLGAAVTRVERPDEAVPGAAPPLDPLQRGREGSIAIDLKSTVGVGVAHRLVGEADVLVEGFRPGVMERLGLGPDVCLERNPRLVYGRMTGWGQEGPRALTAGHDIDYLAVAGVLSTIGRAGESPVPPLNLVADFGGGGMLLVVGVLAALASRERTGRGQVVDAAMVDGSALLASMLHGMRAQGLWLDERGSNLLDGGAPFYDTYRTADGGFMAVGALEPKFYATLLERLGIDPAHLPQQYDRSGWPVIRDALEEAFAARTRTEWAEWFEGTDACVAPVLEPGEAAADPHLVQRSTFIDVGGVTQPAPAPRFSADALEHPHPSRPSGADAESILERLGYSPGEVASMRGEGAVG